MRYSGPDRCKSSLPVGCRSRRQSNRQEVSEVVHGVLFWRQILGSYLLRIDDPSVVEVEPDQVEQSQGWGELKVRGVAESKRNRGEDF